MSQVTVAAIKRLLSGIKDGTHGSFQRVDDGRPLLSAKNVLDGLLEVSSNESQVSESDYQSIVSNGYPRHGDVLLTIVGSIGRSCVFEQHEPIAFQRSVAFLRPAPTVNSRYLSYLLQSSNVQEQLRLATKLAAQGGVYMGDVCEARCTYVAEERQERIADFLDDKTARIESLIAEKERLISTLTDARDSEICKRFVPGLFEDTRALESIAGWKGALPATWHIKSLRRLLTGGLANGVFKRRDEFGSGTLLVNVGDLYQQDFCVAPDALERVTISEEEHKRFAVKEGDIFFVRSSLKEEGVAVSAIAVDVPEPMVFECHVVRARPDVGQVVPRFLSLWLNSGICRQVLRCRANTTTMTTIDQDGILSVDVPIPPMHEQEKIVNEVEALFSMTFELVQLARQMQDRLREYRSSLISAAVTGQLDIRTEAA